MPAKMERQLKKEALKKFGSTTSEAARKYIYGTMQKKTNWKPNRLKKSHYKKALLKNR